MRVKLYAMPTTNILPLKCQFLCKDISNALVDLNDNEIKFGLVAPFAVNLISVIRSPVSHATIFILNDVAKTNPDTSVDLSFLFLFFVFLKIGR